MDGYLTIKQVAEKWGLSIRSVQKMCSNGEIPGASKFGTVWSIPDNAVKPKDKRIKSGKYINWRNRQSINNDEE